MLGSVILIYNSISVDRAADRQARARTGLIPNMSDAAVDTQESAWATQ